MPDYTITHVMDRVRDWDSKGGPMKSYKITLQNAAGQQKQNVELSQKAATAPPKPGDKITGDLDESGQYGPKFKKAYAGGGGGGGFGGGKKRPDVTDYQIHRQHSQDMAIGILSIKYGTNGTDTKAGDLLAQMKTLADALDADIITSAAAALKKHGPIT